MEDSQSSIVKIKSFSNRKILAENATKAVLAKILRAESGFPPSFLFTASHGVGDFPSGESYLYQHQGALLCQDWPGFGAKSPEYYFTGADVPKDSRVHGMITFHFSCYSAGTPSHDRFFHETGKPPRQISDHAFIAALPKALLSHPQGGALACIGHIDRAWGYSFTIPKVGPQIQPFRNFISYLLQGKPVGYAMHEEFYKRYATLSAQLSNYLEPYNTRQIRPKKLVIAWARRNDAEGYVLLGDPATKLRVNDLVRRLEAKEI